MKKPSITLAADPANHVCDFCNSPMIVRDYDCPDFLIPDTWSKPGSPKMDLGSKGKWAACQTCADLVDAGSRNELMARSLQAYYKRHADAPMDGEVAEGIIGFLYQLHDRFWKGVRQ